MDKRCPCYVTGKSVKNNVWMPLSFSPRPYTPPKAKDDMTWSLCLLSFSQLCGLHRGTPSKAFTRDSERYACDKLPGEVIWVETMWRQKHWEEVRINANRHRQCCNVWDLLFMHFCPIILTFKIFPIWTYRLLFVKNISKLKYVENVLYNMNKDKFVLGIQHKYANKINFNDVIDKCTYVLGESAGIKLGGTRIVLQSNFN